MPLLALTTDVELPIEADVRFSFLVLQTKNLNMGQCALCSTVALQLSSGDYLSLVDTILSNLFLNSHFDFCFVNIF